MSGGSRSGGAQVVKQTNELPEWQESHLKRIANAAGAAYDSNFSGFDPYPGATYVPMTGDERSAANWTRGLLGSNPFMQPAMQGFSAISAGQGMLSGQRQALHPARTAAAGFGNVYNRANAPSYSERNLGGMGAGSQSLHNRFGGLLAGPTAAQRYTSGIARGQPVAGQTDIRAAMGRIAGPTYAQRFAGSIAAGRGLPGEAGLSSVERSLRGPAYAQRFGMPIAGGQQLQGQGGLRNWLKSSTPLASESYLQEAARGDFLGGSNPHLEGIIANATRRAQDATGGLFSGAGRYGGGAHQGVAAREAAEIATDFLGREYDQERQRQVQAAAQMDQATLGRRGQELSGLGQQAEADATRRAQAMQMMGLLDDATLGRAGMRSDIMGRQAGIGATRRGQQLQATGLLEDALMGRAGAQADMGAQLGQMDLAGRGQQIQAAGLLDDALLNRVGARAGLLSGDLDRRMAATGQMDNARQARLQQALGALSGQADTSLAAGGQFADARDAYMQNLAMAPALRQMQFSDPNRLMQLGAAERGELQAEQQTLMDRWRDEQLAPLRELEMYSGLVSGLPDLSTRIQTTTGTTPRGSPIAGALGGGVSGATVGANFGPLGAAIGGGLGGILGLVS